MNYPEKARDNLSIFIKDLYALQTTLADRKETIQECFEFETNRQQLYDTLNTSIRGEVEVGAALFRVSGRKLPDIW